ncbi:hypothetical protein LPJ79_003187 [Coemansia sp. RSA 1821]|nr:hypothetical protein LPJ79_003187 [Coemansia sp. RSA 1821]
MDSLRKHIRSQQFVINAWDLTAAFTNIPYMFFFKNSDKCTDFMPSDRLRTSFIRAVQEFPILVGNVTVDRSGRGMVNVDAANLNMPEYLESYSQMNFNDIERNRFSWSSLADKVHTVDSTPAPGSTGVIKLVNVHIVRLIDNSGIIVFLSIPHYVVDGVGYCAFVNRWAEICRSMGGNTNGAVTRSYSFDRSIVDRCMPPEKLPLNTRMRKIYNSPSYLGHLIALPSPELRGSLLAHTIRLMDPVSHVFHISSASLAKLRAHIQTQAPATQRISDNDILTTLISHVVCSGIEDAANRSQGYFNAATQHIASTLMGATNDFLTMVVLDIRSRFKNLAHYVGNCVTCIPVVSPISELSNKQMSAHDLAKVCANVRTEVNATNPRALSKLHSLLSQTPASYAHVMANMLKTPKSVVISNQSRFALYSNDFGNGIPTWVGTIPIFYANFASICPVHPNSDGYNIYITVKKSTMDEILQNPQWNEYVSVVY